MSESIYENNELENEVSSNMSYFWYSDVTYQLSSFIPLNDLSPLLSYNMKYCRHVRIACKHIYLHSCLLICLETFYMVGTPFDSPNLTLIMITF